MEYPSPIAIAAACVGSMTKLASMIGVSPPTVHEWKTAKRPIPVLRCMSIELATEGIVTRKDLRPDDWHKIWPELAAQPQNPATAPAQEA